MNVLVIGQGRADNEEFGRLLRRVRAGRSVLGIAKVLGISPSFVRAIERGERAPRPAIAADLLRELGVAVEAKSERLRFQALGEDWDVSSRYWLDNSLVHRPVRKIVRMTVEYSDGSIETWEGAGLLASDDMEH